MESHEREGKEEGMKLTHHSSQALLTPTTSSLGTGQARWLLLPRPCSAAQPPPFCSCGMRQTQSESDLIAVTALRCTAWPRVGH